MSIYLFVYKQSRTVTNIVIPLIHPSMDTNNFINGQKLNITRQWIDYSNLSDLMWLAVALGKEGRGGVKGQRVRDILYWLTSPRSKKQKRRNAKESALSTRHARTWSPTSSRIGSVNFRRSYVKWNVHLPFVKAIIRLLDSNNVLINMFMERPEMNAKQPTERKQNILFLNLKATTFRPTMLTCKTRWHAASKEGSNPCRAPTIRLSYKTPKKRREKTLFFKAIILSTPYPCSPSWGWSKKKKKKRRSI